MNPDTITLDSLEALEDLLANSCQTVRRIKLKAANGDISPEEAVMHVSVVAHSIATFTGKPEFQL